MNNQQQIFEPLLRQFDNSTRDLTVRDEIAGIFIPTVGPRYYKASKRVFYIGRDSNGWDAGDLRDCIARNFVDEYIENSTEFLNDQGYLHYNKNKASGFWSAAIRMHLRIKGVTEYIPVSLAMTEQYRDMLYDFGYGNTNAIEIPATLAKQGLWNTLNHEQYYKFKILSQVMDKLIYILDAFTPDLIFIFNWDCDEKHYLDSLEYDIKQLSIIENKCWDISLTNKKTRIIWTAHPGNMRFSGYSASAMVDELSEYIHSEKIVH